MNAYSKDLRVRVLAAADRGEARTGIARVFGVSPATVRRALVEATARVRGRGSQALAGQDAEHLADRRGEASLVAPARRA